MKVKCNKNIKQKIAGSFSVFLIIASLGLISPGSAQTDDPYGIKFSGDFRLRYERTTRQEPGEVPDIISDPRNREVVRFRAGFTRKINGLFLFGARFASGSPDDPNTADITLGDFVNDLTISLDKVYLDLDYKNLHMCGGKFANPFARTDMVWDGDVNPQGIAGSYLLGSQNPVSAKVIGAYSIIDEQTIYPDSYMWGSQMQLFFRPVADWSLMLAGAFFDHEIKSLSHADGGDIRSNYVNEAGDAYLSDFNLINAIAAIDYKGFGIKYPLKLMVDFVKNQGATSNQDTGIGLDLFLGKTSAVGDWRVQYGYSQVETDAVLAAFSHDNTTIPTNYQQHTLSINYVLVENTILDFTLYSFRWLDLPSVPGPQGDENEYYTRIRMNIIVTF